MKTRLLLGAFAVGLLVAVGGLTAAEKEAGEKEFKATCPVSGKPAIETSYVENESGKKVYFCCKNCPKAYEKEPEKFANKAYLQMLETEQIVQVGCPVSGHPVDPETAVEIGNTTVAFCCEKCQGTFNEASDDDKVAMLFADFEKGFTLQNLCPVSNKPINPEASVEHDGKKVYFCCEGCPKAFEADPAKFTAKLPQFAKAEK
jgi:YHS domain-containing protein